jgi:hypothetical protein
MMVKLIVVILFSFYSFASAAQTIHNKVLLDSLNEISNSTRISRHFSKLYYKAIEITNRFANDKPENVQQFVFGFESYFGPYFLKADRDYAANKKVSGVWEAYYRYDTLSEMQYQFMGMNTHINGDMHRALIAKYSYDTLKKYKPELVSFQKALNVYFDSLYNTTFKYKKLRSMHHATLGMDRLLGRKMVLHWRMRQINLALLYYTNPKRYRRRCRHLEKVMDRWNRNVLVKFG